MAEPIESAPRRAATPPDIEYEDTQSIHELRSGASSSAPQIDGEISAQLGEEMQAQLAGMTSALQEQLQTIVAEMNNLKSELYSEQGGLAAKLEELTEKATALDGGSSPPQRQQPQLTQRPRPRQAASSSAAASSSSDHTMRAPAPGDAARLQQRRSVEFAPGTKEGPPARGPSNRRMAPRGAQPGWTPYLVGFILLCLGPMRPCVLHGTLVFFLALSPLFCLDVYSVSACLPHIRARRLAWELVKTVYNSIYELIAGAGGAVFFAEEEVPWYDK